MMKSATIVILHAFVVPGLAKEPESNHAMDKLANLNVDTVVDKLVDKLIGMTQGLPKTVTAARPTRTQSQYLASLPGPPALKNMAIKAIQATNGRCVAMKAGGSLSPDLAPMLDQEPMSKDKVKEMAGVTAPFGLFDPMGLATKVPEGRLMFYREAEIKHGRVCMLAILGLIVGDRHDFFPLLAGSGVESDVPAYMFGTPYIQNLPVANFWPALLGLLGGLEWFTAQQANMGSMYRDSSPAPGDFGWDPLGLKPNEPNALKEMQNKELNNGRLAMFATAGYIFQQQAVTHGKIWPFS